jgi:hypothetical protein
MISLIIFLFSVPSFASDPLAENIAILKKAFSDIDGGLKRIGDQAKTCTENYDASRACPGAFPKGIRDSFVDPMAKHNGACKTVWQEKLESLPEKISKPVNLEDLNKVDACTGSESSLLKDFEVRLQLIKDGEAAIELISSGGKGKGTLEAYQELHNSTKKHKDDFFRKASACKNEVIAQKKAKLPALLHSVVDKKAEEHPIPDSPHHGFIKAFSSNEKFPNCSPSVLQGYLAVGDPQKGALAKINGAITKLKSSFQSNRQNLEKAIELAKKRLEKCGGAQAAKAAGTDPKKDKPKDGTDEEKGKVNPEEKAGAPADKKEVVEPAQKTEECTASVQNPYGNTYSPNSCYKAAGTAKERASNLAKLRSEDPAALEKALIDRSTPEAKAMSKKLLDEADAYAKRHNLPSPKVSSRDTVCGESCVAYLKAQSAENSKMDAATVKYLRTKAAETKKQKLQDISY